MTTSSAQPGRDTEIHRISGIKTVGIWLCAAIVRLWCRTVRFELPEQDAALTRTSEPLVFMFWHNRLFVVPWAVHGVRPNRTIYGLVSASRDGAGLARFFEFIGIRSVRGSSSRLGREALHQLIAMARQGHDIAFTPDGPRGPMYDMKAGAVVAARRTGTNLMLLGVHYERAWRVRSWDRLYLPVPFSRARVRLQLVTQEELRGKEDVAAWLRERLLVLSGEVPEPVHTAS